MADDLLWSVFTLWYVFGVIKRVIFDENQGQEVRDSRKSLAEPSWAVSSAPYSLPRRQPQLEGWDSVIEWFCREALPLRTQGSSHGAHPKEQTLLKVQGRKAVRDLVWTNNQTSRVRPGVWSNGRVLA